MGSTAPPQGRANAAGALPMGQSCFGAQVQTATWKHGEVFVISYTHKLR